MQTAFPALFAVTPVSGLWTLSKGAPAMAHAAAFLLLLGHGASPLLDLPPRGKMGARVIAHRAIIRIK